MRYKYTFASTRHDGGRDNDTPVYSRQYHHHHKRLVTLLNYSLRYINNFIYLSIYQSSLAFVVLRLYDTDCQYAECLIKQTNKKTSVISSIFAKVFWVYQERFNRVLDEF